MTEGSEGLHGLESRIGYRFRNASLLHEALTHRSYSNEGPGRQMPHNERLEFLGDAVLDLVISHRMFQGFPDLPEGDMTRIRAEVVSEKNLALVARRLALGECLLLGRGECRSGGREKDSLLANGLEALLGAVFCDGGLAAADAVIDRLFSVGLAVAAGRRKGDDFKTRLQEVLQSRCGRPPDYALIRTEGPDHQRIYAVEVIGNGEVLGSGRGRTKKAAEQEAARMALERMGE